MTQKTPKVEKTISEAERLEAAVESLTAKVGTLADIFERIDTLMGEAKKNKFPQG